VVDLDQVPVKKLLAFRHDHLDKIIAFRAHLSGLEDKLLALAAVKHQERLRLIEGPELKHLLAEHLHLDVRIGLTMPRRRS
jgi:hypothetical protein